MARTPCFIAAVMAVTFAASACNREEPQDGLKAAVDAGKQQSQRQAAADPVRQAHADDKNPLRRKLGDLQIRELLFGPDQTDGDWMAWMPCTQQQAGMPVNATNTIYLKRCGPLRNHLLARAHEAGFSTATGDDVMDPRISGAARGTS